MAEGTSRPKWTPVYMGEGQQQRCLHCGQTFTNHDLKRTRRNSTRLCRESFLRLMDGNR